LNNQSFAYFDTSAWLKLYVRENGSEEARNLARNYHLLSSALLLTESFAALSGKRIIGEMDDKKFNRLVRTMKADSRYVEIINISDAVLDKSQEIVLNSAARTLDAIHIASALIFQSMAEIPVTFITSDRKQYEVAKEKGLRAVFVV